MEDNKENHYDSSDKKIMKLEVLIEMMKETMLLKMNKRAIM